ncbi:hypothetical protein JYU34_007409 [Plutella xylostella]|uniref:Uncharacterized protein n=1 Tax=Plutella xylostella TaxID=51655 RepID=A0ABQ7QQD5_PLUXY|nr:hypothetical protein JYU34_007409 [Plutella xylostella]
MHSIQNKHSSEYNKDFFETVNPIKLTEARNLKLQTDSWGLLTDYYLESVKIDASESGYVSSATLRTGDYSGQIACHIKGPTIGQLFGLSRQDWRKVETLCKDNKQLFYRYFKTGLNNTFSYEQKLFYNFCAINQKKDVLVAIFRRTPNMRTRDKHDAFLQILELRKLENSILDCYQSFLQKNILF